MKRVAAFGLFALVLCCRSSLVFGQGAGSASDDLQWLRANDNRLQWTNVADWESKSGGLEPVRVPKEWRDKWPPPTAARSLSAAGVAFRLNTDTKKIVLRFTIVQVPEAAGANREAVGESSSLFDMYRYFAVYRDGRFLVNVPAATKYTEQELTVYDSSNPDFKARYILTDTSEITVLFPHGYRNNQLVISGIGIDKNAKLLPAPAKTLPVVLFHGDSITHGHGNNSPREAFAWQACEMAHCESVNLGFGGSAWADRAVAEYIASRNDWDVLVIMLGTNSFGGADSSGKPEKANEYKKKYDDFIGVIRAKYPDKTIIGITPILTRADMTLIKNRNGELPGGYRNGIRDALEQRAKTDKHLLVLDGMRWIHDPLYLLAEDQLHPNVAGSLRLAGGIADALKKVLPPAKTTMAAR